MNPRTDAQASSQAAFAAALLDPALPAPPGLRCHHGTEVAARLAVYRNNVVHSLVGVLADTLPVLRELVGASFFAAMAAQFVRERPPSSALMHRYGDELPDWLAAFAPAAALPYLADLARLERARVVAWHAADAEPLQPSQLQSALAEPAQLAATGLVLHPSLTIIESLHPVVSLWQAHQHDTARRDALLADVDLTRAQAALVLRRFDDALVIPLRPADAGLAQALADRVPLGAAMARHPQADITTVLALLLQYEAVVALHGEPCLADPPR